MKKTVFSISLVLVIILAVIIPKNSFAKDEIYFFYGNGCPHCAVVEKYFSDNNFYDTYSIKTLEVYGNPQNALLFNDMLNRLNYPVDSRGVPTVIIGSKILVGDAPILENFEKLANDYLNVSGESNDKINLENPVQENFDLTLTAVVLGSLVDAINPCEFAVLIILMSTILLSGDLRKALWSGLAFSFAIFISYFLMGLGLYKALSFGQASVWFFRVLGWLAIVIGLFNLKDYFWYGKVFLMEVPLTWRPKLKQLIQSVTDPKGAFLIGFLVSLFLLPCTSGPYIVILGMLAKNGLDVKGLFYLLLYNLIFISPMLVITFAVYKGYDPKKAEETRQKKLRILHLITGLVMIGMGVVILSGWM